ncbi:MAG TPA: 23S rRNA (pseudouridine(1915)-N(3))-methyltransferase RlmH [Syntrophomonadaceae bacterium]|nr:23S rRNA (pseudouridine(1915)-N(3))-methyltransferase RlmH [Syntrophomonadaceae bacterium]
MKIFIYSVGKIREPFYINGVKEYLKRLKPYTNIELVDGFEEKLSPKASEKDIQNLLAKEGQKMLNSISPDDLVVLLDIKGKQVSSPAFAQDLERFNLSGKARLNFIIGSSHGVSEAIKKRADKLISFSPMTFPHQMAVLILVEQIYRGFKIIKNEPYHK